MNRYKKLLPATLLLLLGLGIAGILWAAKPVPEGVTVGGLNVGGMTRWEARTVLTASLKQNLYGRDLPVVLPKDTLTLTPKEMGVKIRVNRILKDACAKASDIGLLPYLEFNETALRQYLTDYAAQWDTELVQPKWELSGTPPTLSTESFDPEAQGQTLLITKGIPLLKMDIDLVCEEILTAYNSALIPENFTVTPTVQPQSYPDAPNLKAISEEICVEAVNDGLDFTTHTFVHGSYGYCFDLEQAQQLLDNADWGETVSLPMQAVAPEILGDGVYFRDVLGACKTRHTDDENRNTNLRLLCQTLDGMILQPGETFSYNEALGERTEEKGYKAANAYSGNRLIKDIGGGVCQGSTTLYNCALLADLEVLERVCHGVKVGYVPLGLDAAVNWATKTDLRFRNNFHFPIKIQAEVSDGYVKMKLLGTDEKDYYIEMRCGVGDEGTATYAVSYKCKYSKQSGELLSKDVEARSAYYTLS